MQIRDSCELANGFSIANLSEYKVHVVTVRARMCSLIKTLLLDFDTLKEIPALSFQHTFMIGAIVSFKWSEFETFLHE